MSLQEKVEDLSEVLGLEEGAVINHTQFYCLSNEYGLANVREFIQLKCKTVESITDYELPRLRAGRKNAESENDETKRKEELRRIRSAVEDCLNRIAATEIKKEDVLKAAGAKEAFWKEYTLGGLLLRTPSCASRPIATIERFVMPEGFVIEPSRPEYYEEHRQKFKDIEALTSDDKFKQHVRKELYVPRLATLGRVKFDFQKEGNGYENGYKITCTAEKRFEYGAFRHINVMYACTVHPVSPTDIRGKIIKMEIAVDISEETHGAQRYWSRFYIRENCVSASVARTSSLIPLKKDVPQWKEGVTLSKPTDAKYHLNMVKILVDEITSSPVNERVRTAVNHFRVNYIKNT